MANINQGQTLSPAQPIIFITDGTEIVIEAVNLPASDWPPPPGAPGPRPPNPWIPFPVRNTIHTTAQIGNSTFELEYLTLPFHERNPSGIPSPVRFRALTTDTIQAGEYVTIHFYTHRAEDVLRIPSNTIFTDIGHVYVYRIINNEPIYTPITLYTNTQIFAAISSGLEEGDEVFVRP